MQQCSMLNANHNAGRVSEGATLTEFVTGATSPRSGEFVVSMYMYASFETYNVSSDNELLSNQGSKIDKKSPTRIAKRVRTM